MAPGDERGCYKRVLPRSCFLSVSPLRDRTAEFCSGSPGTTSQKAAAATFLCGELRTMPMKAILVLLCTIVTCGAQKWNQKTSRWDPKEHTSGRTCSNLTQVLDNWKYAILTQVKELLINDPASVLPEYNRIRPLSDALGDLYGQFNSLKEELGKLTSKFDSVEGFVDELQDGRLARPQRPVQRPPPAVGLRAPLRAQMRAHDRRIKGPTLIRARRRGPQRP